MNCKPGDLAYIVRSSEGNERRFVTVMFDSRFRDAGQHWWVCQSASDLSRKGDRVIKAGELACIADCDLRPIRDPGEDARDEALDWKPVPVMEVA